MLSSPLPIQRGISRRMVRKASLTQEELSRFLRGRLHVDDCHPELRRYDSMGSRACVCGRDVGGSVKYRSCHPNAS